RLVKEIILPLLLEDAKKDSCSAALSLGDLRTYAQLIIPELASLLTKKRNYCVQKALYDLGPEGQKHLTEDQIESFREMKDFFNYDYEPKVEPVEPKKDESVKSGIPTVG